MRVPSAVQSDVLARLSEGWFIARQHGPFADRTWLQRGKRGGGGERRKLHGMTFWSLLDREAIYRDSGSDYRVDVWKISDRGKIMLSFGLRAARKK